MALQLPVQAQSGLPSIAWQHVFVNPPGNDGPYPSLRLRQVVRLSANRYAFLGQRRDSAYHRNHPIALYYARAGDSLGAVRYARNHRFAGTTLTTAGRWLSVEIKPDSARGLNYWGFNVVTADTGLALAAPSVPLRTSRFLDLVPGFDDDFGWDLDEFREGLVHPLVRGDGGALTVANLRTPYPTLYAESRLVRVDARGRERSQWLSGWADDDYVFGLAAGEDGSYLAAGSIRGHDPTTSHTYFGRDYYFVRLTPQLDTIATAWVGTAGQHEEAWRVRAAPLGRWFVLGRWQIANPPPGNNALEGQNAEVLLLNADLSVRWRRPITAPGGVGNGPACELYDVQPTLDGGCVALGTRVVQPINGTRPIDSRALLVRLDSLGNVVWQQDYPFPYSGPHNTDNIGSQFHSWSYEADGSAVVLGTWAARTPTDTSFIYGQWLLRLTGLPLPWQANLCATPPGFNAAAITLTGSPGSVPATLTLDSLQVDAGPPYGAIDLVTWQVSDGTPADSGWTVTHAFSGQPVRVRACVTNHLGCRTCQDVFPFGPCTNCPLGTVPPVSLARVQVAPNPSADGRFTLRNLPAGTPGGELHWQVTDAVGRLVGQGTLAAGAAEGVVSLAAQPAGVYALRLLAPDGPAITRRLVRW